MFDDVENWAEVLSGMRLGEVILAILRHEPQLSDAEGFSDLRAILVEALDACPRHAMSDFEMPEVPPVEDLLDTPKRAVAFLAAVLNILDEHDNISNRMDEIESCLNQIEEYLLDWIF